MQVKRLPSAAGITDLFVSVALIPASSGFGHTSAQKDTAHFPRIRGETGVRYERMLFFDDEHKNVARVRAPGHWIFVTCMCFVKQMQGCYPQAVLFALVACFVDAKPHEHAVGGAQGYVFSAPLALAFDVHMFASARVLVYKYCTCCPAAF